MRNAIVIVMIVLGAFCAKAQAPYYAFPDSNATWSMIRKAGAMGNIFWAGYSYNFGSDTTINTKTYHSIEVSSGPHIGPSLFFLRNDTFALTYILNTNNEERILYDFSMQVGDTITNFFWGNNMELLSISTVQLINSERRLFNFSDSTKWIEGIGDVLGFWGNQTYPNPFPAGMVCFRQADSAVYTCNGSFFYYCNVSSGCYYSSINEDIHHIDVTFFPNPTNSYCTIQLKTVTKISISIYDLNGSLTLAPVTNQTLTNYTFSSAGLAPGIYFVKVTDEQGRTATQKLVKE